MPLRGRASSALTILNIAALCIVFFVFAREFVVPFVAERIYKDEYKELMFKCDNVMRDHFIAKSRVLASPSDQAIKTLHAAEVGLSTCHDYDVLRKRLIGLGVSENELSKLGLEAIEEKAKDVHFFVENHEIRY